MMNEEKYEKAKTPLAEVERQLQKASFSFPPGIDRRSQQADIQVRNRDKASDAAYPTKILDLRDSIISKRKGEQFNNENL